MGWSPFVSRSHGFPRGRQADDLDDWARERSTQARAAQAETRAKEQAAKKPAMDTLELSSRQPQQQLGQVQFAPVPIFVSGIDYTA